MPGVIGAFFLVFIPTVGEYVTPSLVGGSSGSMYGNIIFDFFGRSANWPLGAALAVVMLALTLVLVGATSRISRIERFIE
jgi:spermidine/putrescine transport system permease protein